MEGIFITSENLESTAAQVTSLKVQMEGVFDQMRQTIRAMSAFWDSPASRACVSQFEQLSPVFPQYLALVDSYTGFLKASAAAYQDNEAALGA